jgi:subtilisin family serine protease
LTLGSIGLRDDQQAPQDNADISDSSHGTRVASIAGGKLRGVASKANLVMVKFRNAAVNPAKDDGVFKPRGVMDPALEDAFQFIISDVKAQKRNNNNDPTKKYVVNLSYGFRRSENPGKTAILQRALTECWNNGITVVIAAGNEGDESHLDEFTPQNLGAISNELITVGGVDREGKYFSGTNNDPTGGQGAVNLYAGAIDVISAVKTGDHDTSADTGTSFAAPAVVSLQFLLCLLRYASRV